MQECGRTSEANHISFGAFIRVSNTVSTPSKTRKVVLIVLKFDPFMSKIYV